MTNETTTIEAEDVQTTELMPMQSASELAPIEPKSEMMQFLMATKDLDLDKLEKFMALYEREKSRQAEQEFYHAFPNMKAELPRVIAIHTNTQTKSKYAKLDDITDALAPILGKYHFGVRMKHWKLAMKA